MYLNIEHNLLDFSNFSHELGHILYLLLYKDLYQNPITEKYFELDGIFFEYLMIDFLRKYFPEEEIKKLEVKTILGYYSIKFSDFGNCIFSQMAAYDLSQQYLQDINGTFQRFINLDMDSVSETSFLKDMNATFKDNKFKKIKTYIKSLEQ